SPQGICVCSCLSCLSSPQAFALASLVCHPPQASALASLVCHPRRGSAFAFAFAFPYPLPPTPYSLLLPPERPHLPSLRRADNRTLRHWRYLVQNQPLTRLPDRNPMPFQQLNRQLLIRFRPLRLRVT